MRQPRCITYGVRAAAAGCLVLILVGCGSSTPPAERVPELSTRLSAVDQAIAEHSYGQTRRQIQRLVSATVSARDAGELSPDEAEPILAAAASLLSALPQQTRQEPASPRSEPDDGGQPDTSDEESDDGDEDDEKRQKELEKEREELGKEREKLEKEREKLKKEREKLKKEEGTAAPATGTAAPATTTRTVPLRGIFGPYEMVQN